MDRFKSTAIALFAILLCTSFAWADVPQNMSVQGRLTNAGGSPVPAGLKNFTFKIFDAASGGTEIWPAAPGETQLLATDANGLWNARVGAVIPLTDGVFTDSSRWLEVTVDDGVNPIEVLPRIKLNKSPYSSDVYVNAAGDDMTGRLHNIWTQKNTGASVEVDNQNDALGPTWNDLSGTWGVVSDVSGDGNFWNIAVAGAAVGTNNGFEANRGIYGYAGGTGSVNIGVEGATQGDGTSNYSGYFRNGDFIVTAPESPGTDGVQLPPDVIDNTEILDEPGIAFNAEFFAGPTLSPSTTAQDIVTVTITTPATGYIVVHGNATFRYSGTIGANYAWVQIDDVAGGASGARFLWSGGNAHSSTGNEYETIAISRVYSLAAGTYTFRLEGNAYISNAVGAGSFVFQSELMATFHSTSYGSVSALVADRSDFEDAEHVKAIDTQTGQTVEAYAVDLRELELKAARARAEAERTQRELVEARMGSPASAIRSVNQEK